MYAKCFEVVTDVFTESRGLMFDDNRFYTLKGYALLEDSSITASMEDYLEMIYRIYTSGEAVRVGIVAEKLNVKPSSASKMVINLKKQGLVSSEKYGYIKLTEAGIKLGKYLVLRHDILHRLLCYINKSDNELEQVEKIEHFIDMRTVENIRSLLDEIDTSCAQQKTRQPLG